VDISWKQAGLGMTAMLLAAVVLRPSAFEEPVTVTNQTTPPPKVKVVTKTVEKVKVVHLPDGKPPDGYMSRQECFDIPEDMKINEVMYRFGWPAGSNGRALGLGDADYPIREDHGAECHINFPYGTVSSVTYHSDPSDYGGTETWDATS
jgi:hypothetical protein